MISAYQLTADVTVIFNAAWEQRDECQTGRRDEGTRNYITNRLINGAALKQILRNADERWVAAVTCCTRGRAALNQNRQFSHCSDQSVSNWQLTDLPHQLTWPARARSLLPAQFTASSIVGNCLPRTRSSLFWEISGIDPLCVTCLLEGLEPQLRREKESRQPLAEKDQTMTSTGNFPGFYRPDWNHKHPSHNAGLWKL